MTEYIPGETYKVTQPIGTSLSHYSPTFSDGGSPYRPPSRGFSQYPKAGGVLRATSPSRFGGGSPSRTYRGRSPAQRALDYGGSGYLGSPHASLRERESGWAI